MSNSVYSRYIKKWLQDIVLHELYSVDLESFLKIFKGNMLYENRFLCSANNKDE